MRLLRVNFFWLFKAAARKWYADNCLRLGASLSYYTLFSLFPLILVVLSVVQLIMSSSVEARDAVLNALASVTGGFRDEFVVALDALRDQRASSILGIVMLVVGASWVFGELVSAFNIIWKQETPDGGGPWAFLRATFFSFALVLAGAFLLLVSMVVSALLASIGGLFGLLPGGRWLWTLLHALVNLGALTVLFALLLKYLPQTYVAWRDVWLGAALTAMIWTILQFGISYYIAISGYDAYGAVGAALALVVWVYLSSQVLFFGGELTYVYAQYYGSRREMPATPAPASS